MAEYMERISNDDGKERGPHHGKASVGLVEAHAHPTSALGQCVAGPLGATHCVLWLYGFFSAHCTARSLAVLGCPSPISGAGQGQRQRISRKPSIPFGIIIS